MGIFRGRSHVVLKEHVCKILRLCMMDQLIVFLVQEVKLESQNFINSDEQLVLGDLHFSLVQSETESLK